MSLVPSFSAVGTSDPSAILLTDTSTGSDGTITSRLVTLYLNDGSVFYTTTWAIASSSITISPLTKDYALNIVVQWLAGSVVTYSFNLNQNFTAYGETFLYNRIQDLAAFPNIANDQNFISNLFKLRVIISASNQSIATPYNDLGGSQSMIDLYTQLTQNQKLYF